LFLVAHHLVVDAASWHILLEDLEMAYQRMTQGEDVQLDGKTTSFQDWARRLGEFVTNGSFDQELDHWVAALEAHQLPVDLATTEPSTVSREVSVSLDVEDTEALVQLAPAAYRTRINDILLSALAWVLHGWTGDNQVSIDLDGHGREEFLEGVDLSRTVGWFGTVFPVVLTVPDGAPGWRELVRAVRRQLRAIPNNGFGFGALRYLGSSAARQRLALAGPGPEIAFKFLGQGETASPEPAPQELRAADGMRGLYRAVHGPLGQAHDPTDPGPYLLEVVGSVQDRKLRFAWRYRPNRHHQGTIQAVADEFVKALKAIAHDCRSPR
jgi:non-ribosomal peptide synthase protein (TIGR01720 family)